MDRFCHGRFVGIEPKVKRLDPFQQGRRSDELGRRVLNGLEMLRFRSVKTVMKRPEAFEQGRRTGDVGRVIVGMGSELVRVVRGLFGGGEA